MQTNSFDRDSLALSQRREDRKKYKAREREREREREDTDEASVYIWSTVLIGMGVVYCT